MNGSKNPSRSGAGDRSRLSVWAANQLERVRVIQTLNLAPHDVDAMFLSDGYDGLEARSDISLQLRWCPDCARRWHHHVQFQNRKVLRCPWHNAVLREGCPRCGRPVDPLGLPWHCAHCNAALASEPEDWVELFKVAAPRDWPSVLARSHLAYELVDGRVVCHGDDVGKEQFEGRSWAMKYWQRGQLFEAATALWEVVLRGHLECEDSVEPTARMRQYYCQRFFCPVAGAAVAVLDGLVGCSSIDGWPTGPLPRDESPRVS